MLRELRVRNIATLDDVRIECEPGLNVLTGETGAGKTILIDALGAVLGQRAPAEMVRAGASEARAEALFDLRRFPAARARVEALGVCMEDATLLLVREIGGRARAYANGSPMTIGMLREIGALLVEIHGQHEGQRLLEPAAQLDVLDGAAGEVLERMRERVATLVRMRAALTRRLADLDAEGQDRTRRLDLLRYQIAEIDAAGLRDGDLESLQEAHARLSHAERLRESLEEAYGALYGDEGCPALVALGRTRSLVRQAAGLDPGLSSLAGAAAALHDETADLAHALRRYLDGLDSEPARLEEIERRLDALRSLLRKYGATIPEVLAYREQAVSEVERLASADAALDAIAGELRRVERDLGDAASHLSDCRRHAAQRLESAVASHLADLGMPGAGLEVSLRVRQDPRGVEVNGTRAAVGERGMDRVEFMFSTNPGEPPRPLHRVASGGELARIMLALRSGLAGSAPLPVMVFDEVDAGVGGRAGYTIGQKLAALAQRSQVLCVTHLPQVAAMAAHHIVVRKASAQGRTRTATTRVDGTLRVEEIARMLSGAHVVDTARRHAQRLLDDAAIHGRRGA
jgi:DNA repair protein RecN (Recombination protein N)